MAKSVPQNRRKPDELDRMIRDRIAEVLEKTGGNICGTARELGMDYKRLHRLVNKLGLRKHLERVRREAERRQAAA